MSLLTIRSLDRNLEKIVDMYVDKDQEFLFVFMPKNPSEIVEQVARRLLTDMKVVRICDEILCFYKHQVENPLEHFSHLCVSLFNPSSS